MLAFAIYKKTLPVIVILAFAVESSLAAVESKKSGRAHATREEITHEGNLELWRAPRDIRARNLFYGEGGKDHAPHTTYYFIKEDMHGTNPKLKIRDENGLKWRVKMGVEARPETTASRLVWAVGYTTNQFYFLPQIRIQGLPAHLRRGQNLVSADGTIRRAEMRREVKSEKKMGHWSWRHNPFSGTRELNGLRVMMALLNNWDLKDENNGVYQVREPGRLEEVYRVTDLGASFGKTGASWRVVNGRGGVRAYRRSKFIRKVSSDDVDFNDPTRPSLIFIFNPRELISRLRMRWIGRGIPRADARWMGSLLAQLSEDQIRDAFRAGGYNPQEVEAYTQVVERRIRELNGL